MNPSITDGIGQPAERKDAWAKVTGTATYAAEFQVPHVAYVTMVKSTIANGRIRRIDVTAAKRVPGVLAIITHENMPKLHLPKKGSQLGEKLIPMQSDQIFYDGQTIGLVVADSFERAEETGRLVKVDYESQPPVVEMEAALGSARAPDNFFGREKMQLDRGDVDVAFARQDLVLVDETYETPLAHHNPMEPHASTALWHGDELTIYTSTQGVMDYRKAIAAMLALPEEKVSILSPYVGGGFGCKGFVWFHPILAAVAARQVGRPAKLVHSRDDMFTSNGHRPRTIQRLRMAAERDGKLVAIQHEVISHTSKQDDFMPAIGITSAALYASPHARITHRLTSLNLGNGTPARAPGEAPGTYALETAMDELAHALGMDPLDFRRTNFTPVNAQKRKPWSSNHLEECYRKGADAFGWERRQAPGLAKDGNLAIGYGMAMATYPAIREKASARVQVDTEGNVHVLSATQDIGTGTYTILAQIAAEVLGMPIERIKVHIGDASLPKAPGSGGSRTAASVGPAVDLAAKNLKEKLVESVQKNPPPFFKNVAPKDLTVAGGCVISRTDPSLRLSLGDIVKREKHSILEAEATALTETSDDEGSYAFQSFGTHFVEVSVDVSLGEVRVRRVVSAMDIGRVLNPRTARSQVMGGVVMGIGMALMEQTILDRRRGRFVTRNLTDYRVPVNADIPEIDVIFIDQPDPHINSLGCRGVGEIGITGITAAIGNAVFNATGKRIRTLPITPEKLI